MVSLITMARSRALVLAKHYVYPGRVLGTWQATWNHALSGYYRARPIWALTPWLGATGIGMVWGIYLVGTLIGVAVYPQATDVTCDWWTCYYPLLRTYEPFELLMEMPLLVLIGGVLLLAGLGALAFVWRVIQGLRGRWNPQPKGATLANGWHNGMIAMLSITPPAPDGLVRMRFLSRVYHLWRQRALIAMIFGVFAALITAPHVVYPILWWLGPWRQWAVQLILVLLWCAAGVSWLINAAAYATLSEVTYSPEHHALIPGWKSVGAVNVIAMVFMPIVVSRLYFAGFSYLNFYDTNVHSVVSAPLIMLALGPILTAWNYGLAQIVFWARTRNL